MTMQLTLEYGSTTLDFQADGYKVIDGFYPETATDPDKPVSERFDVLIIADDHTDLEGKIQAIGLAINQAKIHKTGPNGVYLNFAMLDDDDTWRARVTDGLVMWNKELDKNWRRNKAVASVVLVRAPAWEGPEAQLSLTNPLGTEAIDGLTVYNPSLHRFGNTISFNGTTQGILDSANGLGDFLPGMTIAVFGSTSNDGSYVIQTGGAGGVFVDGGITTEGAGDYVGIDGPICNYVQIAGADIAGELPAPVRLEITNNYDSASRASSLWIGQNVLSDPANLEHILQAEDADGVTPVDDGAASGNQTVTAEWNGTTEDDLLTWDLTTELLDQLRGNYQRILIHFGGSPGVDIWLRLTVYLDVTALWTGPLVGLNSTLRIQEITSLRLPPYLLDADTLYPLTLTLSAKHASSGDHGFSVDHLQITPLDGWRKLVPSGYNLEHEQRLVDDGIDGYLYTDSASPAGKAGYYVGYGEPIHLQPGVLQRLYFLHDNDSGSAPVVRTLSIKAFYRPRRWTV